MSSLAVTAFFDDATFTVTYVAADPETGRAAIIDPVLDYDPSSGRMVEQVCGVRVTRPLAAIP